MKLAFSLSSVLLVLTCQTVQADAGSWQATPPDQPHHQIEATADATDPSGTKPEKLPMILGEKPQEEAKEPASLEPFMPREASREPVPTETVPGKLVPRTAPPLKLVPHEATTPRVAEGASPQEAPREVTRASLETAASVEQPVTSNELEQLIKDSVATPQQDSRISGRPLRLLDVLSVVPAMPQPQPRANRYTVRYGSQPGQSPFPTQVLFRDPREEQKRVDAYWELAQSLGQYNLTRQLVGFWDSVSAQPGDEAILRTARTSTQALLCEARVTLVADQYSLVEAADLAADQELPLPSDPPHVGTYFTHFDKLFAGKPAPALGRRLDATLPLCRETIEGRACSTLSARRAAESLAKEYAAGRCTFEKLASAVDQWRKEQQSFLRAAYVYNYNICEYVVSVAGLPADRGTLVTMLIRPTYPVAPEVSVQPINQVPVSSGLTPTLAPPLRDPAVQPASGQLPILQYVPRTAPPVRRQGVYRIFPTR